MRGALDGIRVVDLTRFLAGPYCTMMLGDMGAEVLKIEPPGEGDESRAQQRYRYDGETAYYLSANRNKQGLVIDLKHPDGLAVFHDLARVADVVVHNFRPRVADRFGLRYEALKGLNPRLVCCGLTAFGRSGPHADKPAYDLVVQAMGGGMSITGEPGGAPARMGLPIGDLAGAMFAAFGILSALLARERTGLGQDVETSLLAGQIALHTYVAAYYWHSGEVPGRAGSAHASMVPYQTFRAADGWIAIVAHTPKFWRNLCRALGLESLAADPRFATLEARLAHREALIPTLEAAFARKPCAEWCAILERADVPCGPVNTVDRALADPAVLAEGMVRTIEHAKGFRVKVTGNPVKLSATPGRPFTSPPTLGQHTDQVLRELLGYPAARVRALREAGAVG
jgi:formyl-CoA transferase/CoA:oxalate CoA-transferase